jgi:hypothetical protein
MTEALLFIEEYQTWIYLALVAAILVYLRVSWRWYRSRQATIFSLEREHATAHLTRAATLLGLALVLLVGTFAATTFLGPAVPASARPTPLPTVSLLATETFVLAEGGDQAVTTATPLPTVVVDSAGCANAQATITSPETGESLSGIIEISGTAEIPNFAFYKYEYISRTAGAVWRAIQAGTTTVRDGLLGTWDTRLVLPGEYALRLVVTDTAGNAPQPCVILVRVMPSETG